MREFFKGWRRKMGCVTLVMACVFMAGWIDGSNGPSAGMFKIAEDKYAGIIFSDAGISWATVQSDGSMPVTPTVRANLGSEVMASVSRVDWDADGLGWCWRWCGFGYRHLPVATITGGRLTIGTIYWSITIPLTALSAFLLLSRPRPSTPKRIPELIPIEGA